MNKFSIILFAGIILISCQSNKSKIDIIQDTSDSLKINTIVDEAGKLTEIRKEENDNKRIGDSVLIAMINLTKVSDLDYHSVFTDTDGQTLDFFYGYTGYNDEEFSNPAYLKVFADNNEIYNETFSAYDRISLEWMGTYTFFSDTLGIYILKYGLEACDYIRYLRLYFLNRQQIRFIDEFFFQSTDYAFHYHEFIWPSDSGGSRNTLISIEKYDYFTEEEPNRSDTTYYYYRDNTFNKLIKIDQQ